MLETATHHYQPKRYFGLTFATTFILWFAGGYLSFREDPSGLYMLLMLSGLLAPCLISAWMQLRVDDPALRKDALDKLLNVRRMSIRQLPVVFLLMPLMVLCALLLSLPLGESVDQFNFSEGFSFSTGFLPTLLLLIFAALFEELGWRGYAFDSLLAGRSYLTASLLFSMLWSLWHLPLLWVNHTYQYQLLQENVWYAVNFYVSIIPMGLIMCWVCAKNNGSVITAVLFHFSINISQEALAISQNTKCLETVILVLVAGAFILYDRDVFAISPSANKSSRNALQVMAPKWQGLLLVLFIVTFPLIAEAQSPDNKSTGFSGKVQAGALFMQTDSQLTTAGNNQRNKDLDGPTVPNALISGMATAFVRYEFENGAALYAGNPLELSEGLALMAGVSQPLGRSTLDLSVDWLPMAEVWRNPYRVEGRRSETDADIYGMHVQWQEIGGGPWELGYRLQHTSVGTDTIGALEGNLKRSGWTHELEVKRSITIRPWLSLTPGLSASYGDKEGESNRYAGGKTELVLQGVRPPWALVGLISGAFRQYQKTHPLFDETRQEIDVTLFAQVIRQHLFGREALFASLGGGYVWSDANIDFFDSHSTIALMTVGVEF